jgi:hypothetical protein
LNVDMTSCLSPRPGEKLSPCQENDGALTSINTSPLVQSLAGCSGSSALPS